jgi:hypothetical protein
MRKIFFLLILFLIGYINSIGQVNYYDYKLFNVNNIFLIQNNLGSLEYRIASGAFWNFTEKKDSVPYLWSTIVYDHGLWVIGKVNNKVCLAYEKWRSNFSPGPIINGQPALQTNPQDSTRFRVYKINMSDNESNIDYAEWPADLGAPVDKTGKPLVSGDQMLWTVFNSLDTNYIKRYTSEGIKSTYQLPLEIHEKIYGRKGYLNDSINFFNNVVFFEWEIINKGEKQIDSTFIGFWTDIDFCNTLANPPGVDVNHQLGYCWSGTDNYCFDPVVAPIAVGYVLLYGPVKASPGGKAMFKGKEINNFENLPISSFFGIADDAAFSPLFGNPSTLTEAWNAAKGLQLDGNIFINPITNQPAKFPFNGDPVSDTGWIFPYKETGGGAGFLMFSGPLNLMPADTQWIMIALVPAAGKNRFESIELMRQKADKLRSLPYDSLAFGTNRLALTSVNQSEVIPDEFKLYQNYPNPFNPSTTIKYSIPSVGTSSMKSVQLKLYDILGKEVATLINEKQNPGIHHYTFSILNYKLSSGVYFYQLRAGNFSETKKMIVIK